MTLQTRASGRRRRVLTRFARAIIAATATVAWPSTVLADGDRECLWSALSPAVQLRLELAARAGAGALATEIQGIGDRRALAVLQSCGFAPSQATAGLMAQIWAARANVAGKRAAARAAGIDLAVADAALLKTAPLELRQTYAAEIAARVNAGAARAISAALDIAASSAPLSKDARLAGAEYFAASILLDGLLADPNTER